MEKLETLVRKCFVGDLVLLHFENGNHMPKIYAGVLKGNLAGKNVSEELIFVESQEEIESCKRSRNYLKISSGYTARFPGIKVVGYDFLEKVSR